MQEDFTRHRRACAPIFHQKIGATLRTLISSALDAVTSRGQAREMAQSRLVLKTVKRDTLGSWNLVEGAEPRVKPA